MENKLASADGANTAANANPASNGSSDTTPEVKPEEVVSLKKSELDALLLAREEKAKKDQRDSMIGQVNRKDKRLKEVETEAESLKKILADQVNDPSFIENLTKLSDLSLKGRDIVSQQRQEEVDFLAKNPEIKDHFDKVKALSEAHDLSLDSARKLFLADSNPELLTGRVGDISLNISGGLPQPKT
jgi:type I site-specific restriction endonuclease